MESNGHESPVPTSPAPSRGEMSPQSAHHTSDPPGEDRLHQLHGIFHYNRASTTSNGSSQSAARPRISESWLEPDWSMDSFNISHFLCFCNSIIYDSSKTLFNQDAQFLWNVKYVYFESCLGKCIIIRGAILLTQAKICIVGPCDLYTYLCWIYFCVFIPLPLPFIVDIKTTDYDTCQFPSSGRSRLDFEVLG